MVGTSSSCASFDDVSVVLTEPVKLLCSYGGKILPRRLDGRLRYVGGHTRILAVRRSISFSGIFDSASESCVCVRGTELQVKLRELCGWGAVSLRCQLPTEDMDALVSVTSDEDLANLVEEYDLASRDRRMSPPKIRAFLLLHRASEPSCTSPVAAADRCVRQASVREKLHSRCEKPNASAAAGDLRVHGHRHFHPAMQPSRAPWKTLAMMRCHP
ncbi:hypothetical protein BHM03_00027801 [Ensete ventricosum]|nr:hypothetical protein BHM03_00027801 [Ensete ventricosum]